MDSEILVKAIKKINPNAQCGITGGDINSIEWREGTTPISVADIQAQISAAEFDMAIKDLRTKRDKLIGETDYLALSDQTLSTEMSTSRQALRDITNGSTTAEQASNGSWPGKPE